MPHVGPPPSSFRLSANQCDQIKIAKCLKKLPKNDFTRKMIDFNAFTKIGEECGRFGQIN